MKQVNERTYGFVDYLELDRDYMAPPTLGKLVSSDVSVLDP
jgi:hypothetical protein